MRQRLAALVALSLSSFIGCATVKKVNIYTVPQEMALGEVFSSQVEQSLPVLGDPQVDWYLNHKGRLLAGLSTRPDLPYFFATIDTPELNAFAIPGGHGTGDRSHKVDERKDRDRPEPPVLEIGRGN